MRERKERAIKRRSRAMRWGGGGSCLARSYKKGLLVGVDGPSGTGAGTFLAGLEKCLFTEVDLLLQRPKRRGESHGETSTSCSHTQRCCF